MDFFATRLGPIDEALPPEVLFSTFLGGSGGFGIEFLNGAAVDRRGAIYLTGGTEARNYPIKKAAQKKFAGGGDAVLSKIK